MGYFWNLCDIDAVYKIKGSQNGIILADNPEVYRFIRNVPVCSVVVIHNHPRNGLFSAADLMSFSDFNSIYAMTAICNDGTIYMMKKHQTLILLYFSSAIMMDWERGYIQE